MSHATIATAAAARLFIATAGRPFSCPRRINDAMTVARTQLELSPVTSAYAQSRGIMMRTAMRRGTRSGFSRYHAMPASMATFSPLTAKRCSVPVF